MVSSHPGVLTNLTPSMNYDFGLLSCEALWSGLVTLCLFPDYKASHGFPGLIDLFLLWLQL